VKWVAELSCDQSERTGLRDGFELVRESFDAPLDCAPGKAERDRLPRMHSDDGDELPRIVDFRKPVHHPTLLDMGGNVKSPESLFSGAV